MIKWEDTVISGHYSLEEFERAKNQAKASFEAGRKEELKRVVRGLNAIDKDAEDAKSFTRRVCDLIVEYEAQLKE